MGLRTHEIHPSIVHGPLTLLPAAAVTDLLASIRRDRRLERLGSGLWLLGTATGLAAGLAGMAASQEVRPSKRSAADMMMLHGIGNLGIVTGALVMSLWRTRRRPTVLSSALGLAASSVAVYTAYLGGKLVYSNGVGVEPTGVGDSPSVLSRKAPVALARDAFRGLRWLLGSAERSLAGARPIDRAAFGVTRGRVTTVTTAEVRT